MFLRFAKRTRISDLEEGSEAVVEGKVVASSPLDLPGKKGTKCVYYDVLKEVFRRGERGAGRKLWLPESADQKLAGFHVEDDTGKVWAAASGDDVDVSGAPSEAWVAPGKGNVRYSARVIPVGAVVRIKGKVDKPRRREPRKGLVLRPGAKGRLKVLVRRLPEKTE